MAKFKVGDRVIGNKLAEDRYAVTKTGWRGVVTSVDGDFFHAQASPSGVNFGLECKYFDLAPADSKVLITTDGKITTARLYDGNKMVKTAEAKCAPSDTYDFNTGATLAFDRLMGRDIEPYAEPQKNSTPAAVKLYCVKTDEGWVRRGSTYEFVDGDIRLEQCDHTRGLFEDYADFERHNRSIAACLYPLVSRHAKVGEWITPIEDSEFRDRPNGELRYKKGELLQCTKRPPTGVWAGKAVIYNNTIEIIKHGEYLVLDGYDGRYEEKPVKEMTVAEIEKALGYSVKVVKGESSHD